ASQIVKERDHLLEISRTLVIDDANTTQIELIVSGGRTDALLVAEDGDARDTLTRRFGSRNHGAGIIPFRQNDVLRP
ncbi:MAG: hypothetical protein V7638_568, partial [Acidobacteriota bacterium]